MNRFLGAIACGLVVLAVPGHAAELPQYVRGPISGLQLGCEEAKQKVPPAEAYVTQGDLDADGKPDFIVEIAKGCKANHDLYCNDEGCLINIFLSTEELQMGSLKVKSFKIGKSAGKPALLVTKGGSTCSKLPGGLCQETLVFNGQKFVVVP